MPVVVCDQRGVCAMSIEIPISPDIEAALRKHATDAGLPIETIAARLLDRTISWV